MWHAQQQFSQHLQSATTAPSADAALAEIKAENVLSSRALENIAVPRETSQQCEQKAKQMMITFATGHLLRDVVKVLKKYEDGFKFNKEKKAQELNKAKKEQESVNPMGLVIFCLSGCNSRFWQD